MTSYSWLTNMNDRTGGMVGQRLVVKIRLTSKHIAGKWLMWLTLNWQVRYCWQVTLMWLALDWQVCVWLAGDSCDWLVTELQLTSEYKAAYNYWLSNKLSTQLFSAFTQQQLVFMKTKFFHPCMDASVKKNVIWLHQRDGVCVLILWLILFFCRNFRACQNRCVRNIMIG